MRIRASDTPSIIVMAKPVVPGQVKTRMIGPLTPEQAARAHQAMLECVLTRTECHIRCKHSKLSLFLAIARFSDTASDQPYEHLLQGHDAWRIVDQGGGDLGQRLIHVWRRIGGGRAMLFGVDSPDVPAHTLGAILPALDEAEVAIGRVEDGGFWTLAARGLLPELLRGIDWGSDRVYHQAYEGARRQGASVIELTPWFDVDTVGDLEALRKRLSRSANAADDPALVQLAADLDQVCKGY